MKIVDFSLVTFFLFETFILYFRPNDDLLDLLCDPFGPNFEISTENIWNASSTPGLKFSSLCLIWQSNKLQLDMELSVNYSILSFWKSTYKKM